MYLFDIFHDYLTLMIMAFTFKMSYEIILLLHAQSPPLFLSVCMYVCMCVFLSVNLYVFEESFGA